MYFILGAAHVHGTLWIDWDSYVRKLVESKLVPSYGNLSEEAKESLINKKAETLKKAFKHMRKEELGIGDTLDAKDTKDIMDALEEFTDSCISCSLMDPTTRDIVMEVNKHQHFVKSCRKNGPKCKYGFPRFPSTKTIISIPSRILYKKNDEKEKEMEEKSSKIKKIFKRCWTIPQ